MKRLFFFVGLLALFSCFAGISLAAAPGDFRFKGNLGSILPVSPPSSGSITTHYTTIPYLHYLQSPSPVEETITWSQQQSVSNAVIYVCSETTSGGYDWAGKTISTGYYNITLANWFSSLTAFDENETCQQAGCADKEGTTAGYNIETYHEGSSPDLSDQCVDGCAVSAEVHESLGPCVQSQCIVSVKYTYTGQQCGGEDLPLDEEPPSQCYAEWTALVNKCGGASNVATFDWSTCSGECLKKDCSDEYAALADSCGGYLYIASWDNTTCQGVCANFSTPSDENGDAPPSNITTTTQTNSDGSSTVTNWSLEFQPGAPPGRFFRAPN